jgi:S1-C subfamily serine protease
VRQSVIFLDATVQEPSGQNTEETGSGFIITSSGYALTANHVIQSPDAKVEVIIGSRTGTRLSADVISIPGVEDAALLKLPDSHAPYQAVQFDNPLELSVGSNLISIGFPLDQDISLAAPGSLTKKDGTRECRGCFQISVPLNNGNSGGPVIDNSGNVVGLVKGGIPHAQQMNYMIPVNLLSPLISEAGLPWPPWSPPVQESVSSTSTLPVPPLTPPLSGAKNCHEITVVSAGLPPVYTKRIVCE